MTINRQQRNIINPYVLEDIEYDFITSKRNIFVISAIHEYFISAFNFLPQDKILRLSIQELEALGVEKDTPNLVVSAQDLRAYSFLYPQNCNLVEDNDKVSLELIGDEISNTKLRQLVTKLDENGHLSKYLTNSSPTAILPENINSTSIETAHTKLIAILPFHSSEYRKLIYKSIGDEQVISLDDYQSIEKLSLSVVASSYINSDENVDIYDWRANCEPGTETNKIYYNSIDDRFYFTERTELAETQLFDQGYWNEQNSETYRAIFTSIRKGVSEILKYTGRYSPANVERIINIGLGQITEENKIHFLSHLDIRPGSRWIYAVRIPRSAVEAISENNDVFVSYDEFELTPLERASVLLDPDKNKSSIKSVTKAENLVIHLPRVINTLSVYAKQLAAEDINPEDLQGIDLNKEIRILDGFIDDLALACIYNKVRLDDEDVIEFAFTDSYSMEYFTFNGYLMTRGVGNIDFYPQNEEDENNKVQKILNTFSDSTPTTFSAVSNSQKIYNDYSIVDEDNLMPWVDFFKDYLYPSVELSAEKIRQKAVNSKASARRKRRKNIFTKVSELAKEGKDIEDFYRRINSSRNPYYQIGRAITSLDCDTGQAQALKDIMKLWSLFDSKISIRGKIREAILLLRDEVVKDSVTRAYLTQAIQAEENPQLFIRDIEKQINEQIFCGLDVLGNVIETSFLDPGDMNPTLKSSGATPASKAPMPVKIELKVPKGWKGAYETAFSKDKDLYEKIIIKMVSAYLKSVAVGIGKDVIKAALGCGPDNNRSETLDDALRDLKYGILDLNRYVEDLDIVDIAKSVDLVNVSRTNVEGTEVVTKTDPSYTQIQQFITDVSNMCTPRELDLLIFGSADNVLYELILETVTDGVITFTINSDLDPNGDEEIEKRKIDPNIYGSFEFTKDKIKDFFLALGDAMRDENIEEIAQLNISPLEAYCSNLDPDLGLDRLGFTISPEQLEIQYASIAEDKINKINALCDWLKDLDNILKGLQELINNLPIMKYYEEFLEVIAALSNMMWKSLSELWDDLFGEDIKNDKSYIINFYMTQLGKDLFYSIYRLISRHILTAQTSITRLRLEDDTSGFYAFGYTVPTDKYLDFNQDVANFFGASNKFSRLRPDKKNSPLKLPYPAPDIIDDNSSWLWAGPYDDVKARIKDQETSYALRTSDQILRNRLFEPVSIDPNSEAQDTQRWNQLYGRLESYLSSSWSLYDTEQWISKNPQNAKTFMSINNINQGGVQVSRLIRGVDGVIERKIIAEYVPQPGDIEPNQQSVDYYAIMSNISRTNIGEDQSYRYGGPLTEGPRRRVIMPSKSNELLSWMLDVSMFGQLRPETIISPLTNQQVEPYVDAPVLIDANVETESLSVASPYFIDESIDFIFGKTEGKNKLKNDIRGSNKPLYKANNEDCVNTKEVGIANAMALCIQSRLQRFFINTIPAGSAFPHWNSLGTHKLIIDYLYKKIYPDLESKGLVNVIYEYSNIFNKVYVDNPENNLSPINNNSPKEYIRGLIDAIYSSMLINVSENVYTKRKTSPYEPSETRNRYVSLIKTFYEKLAFLMTEEIRLRSGTPSIFGITGESALQTTINFINQELLDQNGQPTDKGIYYGAYYYPIGFFIAQYLITYDSIINITRNYGMAHYKSLTEISNADDSLLSSILEQDVTRYSDRLIGFPYNLVVVDVNDELRRDVSKVIYSLDEAQRRLRQISIQTGLDNETFPEHLIFFRNRTKSTPIALAQTFLRAVVAYKGGIEDLDAVGYDISQVPSLVNGQRLIPTYISRYYASSMIQDFLIKVINGELPPIEQSLISRLNWFSLGDRDIPALRNAYGDFFESKVVTGDVFIDIPGFNISEIAPNFREDLRTTLRETFYIRGYDNIESVIRKFSEQLRFLYQDFSVSDRVLEEKASLETIPGIKIL